MNKLVFAIFTVILALACAAGALIIVRTVKNNRPAQAEEPVSDASEAPAYLYENVPLYAYNDFAFSTDGNLKTYSDESFTGVAGIDVSNHNGQIDWQAVAESGVEFAMISVGYRGYTEGALTADASFETNIRGALDAGLEVGVYIFSQAVSMTEAQEEAQFVLDSIEGYDISYPVVFDWETVSSENGRTHGMSDITITNCAIAFCEMIKEAGYTPMVYFNKAASVSHFELDRLTGYDFWLASYSYLPGFDYDFAMWQYSATGQIPGVPGDVDLNLFFRPAEN